MAILPFISYRKIFCSLWTMAKNFRKQSLISLFVLDHGIFIFPFFNHGNFFIAWQRTTSFAMTKLVLTKVLATEGHFFSWVTEKLGYHGYRKIPSKFWTIFFESEQIWSKNRSKFIQIQNFGIFCSGSWFLMGYWETRYPPGNRFSRAVPKILVLTTPWQTYDTYHGKFNNWSWQI